mgnify:CR=1 FL=1
MMATNTIVIPGLAEREPGTQGQTHRAPTPPGFRIALRASGMTVVALFFLCFANVAFADPVTLRPRVEANGPAITLGDLFDGAGAVSSRAIAPSPPPGQISNLSMQVVSAAAAAAGLDFTPPSGVNVVQVVHPGGARATLPPPAGFSNGRVVSDAAIHRGEMVLLTYQMPGMMLSTRARALEDAGVGQSIHLLNLTSNHAVDAVVTAPGAASASPQ